MKKKYKKLKRIYSPSYQDGGYFSDPQSNKKKGYFDNSGSNTLEATSPGSNVSGISNPLNQAPEGYNKIVSGVSKIPFVGGIVSAANSLESGLIDPLVADASEIDQNTGKYKDIGKAERWQTGANYLNPLKAGLNAMADPNATTTEKIGSFLSVPGTQRLINRRREGENTKIAEENRRNKAAAIRLQEESLKPTMKFGNGGTTTQRGISTPTYRNITPTTFNQQLLRKGMLSPGYDTLSTGNINEQIMKGYNVKEGFAAPYKVSDTDKGRVYQKDYGRSKGEYYDSSGSGKVVDIYNTPRTGYASGGYLEETRNNPDVTYFANGGSHGDNPNGGIPLGNKGKVEEGEIKWKDYIFTNRF